MLSLDKDWLAVAEDRAVTRLTGEEKRLIWLQAWTAVGEGTACWLQRWHAVTWGHGPAAGQGEADLPYGTDERFKDGKLHGPAIKRQKASSQVDTP